MIVRFTKNIAINTKSTSNGKIANFYKDLGLQGKEAFPEFTILNPAPFSCYVVSWSPEPKGGAEVALQLETDSIEQLRLLVVKNGGEILFFGKDENDPNKTSLWFRDPAGILINATEIVN